MLALFQKYFWVFFISMVPLVELRGAIPVGVASGLPLLGTYLVAIIGNMLPVPVIILFSKQVLLWCCKLPGGFGRFFQAIYDKGMKAGDKLQQKAGRGLYFALFLFVAIPLPGTGAWTGALIAAVLNMRLKRAVPVIFLGVVIAGCIITLLTHGVTLLF